MKLIKNDESIILFDDDDKEIEQYNLDKEINFKKYVEYLLSLNLSKEIEIIDSIDNKTEAEENLIMLINRIKEDYNGKVKELANYKENYISKFDKVSICGIIVYKI